MNGEPKDKTSSATAPSAYQRHRPLIKTADENLLMYCARISAKRLVKEGRDTVDRRLKQSSINGQMQDIYLEAKRMGLSLSAEHLLTIWWDQCSKEYQIEELRRKLTTLLRQQASIACKIKSLTDEINAAEREVNVH